MHCPKCSNADSIVKDSRPTLVWEQQVVPRRRRECQNCGHRWSTLELPVDRNDLPILSFDVVDTASLLSTLDAAREKLMRMLRPVTDTKEHGNAK